MESASRSRASKQKRRLQRRGGSINNKCRRDREKIEYTYKYVWSGSSIDLTLIYQDLPATR